MLMIGPTIRPKFVILTKGYLRTTVLIYLCRCLMILTGVVLYAARETSSSRYRNTYRVVEPLPLALAGGTGPGRLAMLAHGYSGQKRGVEQR